MNTAAARPSMQINAFDSPRLRLRLIGAVAALALATFAGWFIAPKQFAYSYLVAWVFAVSLATGGLFWVLLHHLTAAVWSVVVRRTAEHLALAIVPLALLGIPVMINLGETHGWVSAHDPIWEKKSAYLNPPFLIGRTVLFLAAWSLLAAWLWRQSTGQDHSGDAGAVRRMRSVAPIGLIVLGITTTFFSFDWLMSLEWHWTSTMYGVTFWAGAIVGSLALMTLLVLVLRINGVTAITEEHLHDLGKLLFGFTVFWAYIAFSQYFLVWYANLSEETPWYLHRLEGSWRGVALALMVGHFVVPFAWLLPRSAKRTPWRLGLAAACLLAFHLLDIYWQVLPVLHHEGVQLSWLDLAAPLAMLAIVIAVVTWGFTRFKPVPPHDPNLAASLAHHNE